MLDVYLCWFMRTCGEISWVLPMAWACVGGLASSFHVLCVLQLPGKKLISGLGSEVCGLVSGSVESARLFLQDSLARVSMLQSLEAPGAQDLLDFTIRYQEQLCYIF